MPSVSSCQSLVLLSLCGAGSAMQYAGVDGEQIAASVDSNGQVILNQGNMASTVPRKVAKKKGWKCGKVYSPSCRVCNLYQKMPKNAGKQGAECYYDPDAEECITQWQADNEKNGAPRAVKRTAQKAEDCQRYLPRTAGSTCSNFVQYKSRAFKENGDLLVVAGVNRETCKTECDTNVECEWYVWRRGNGQCQLFSAAAAEESMDAMYMGEMDDLYAKSIETGYALQVYGPTEAGYCQSAPLCTAVVEESGCGDRADCLWEGAKCQKVSSPFADVETKAPIKPAGDPCQSGKLGWPVDVGFLHDGLSLPLLADHFYSEKDNMCIYTGKDEESCSEVCEALDLVCDEPGLTKIASLCQTLAKSFLDYGGVLYGSKECSFGYDTTDNSWGGPQVALGANVTCNAKISDRYSRWATTHKVCACKEDSDSDEPDDP